LNKFKGKRSSSISSFEFQRNDIQREDVVKEVLEIYGGDVPDMYKLSESEDDEELKIECINTQEEYSDISDT
jgi:hypothetical protein